jgi:hypothetical protein
MMLTITRDTDTVSGFGLIVAHPPDWIDHSILPVEQGADGLVLR